MEDEQVSMEILHTADQVKKFTSTLNGIFMMQSSTIKDMSSAHIKPCI